MTRFGDDDEPGVINAPGHFLRQCRRRQLITVADDDRGRAADLPEHAPPDRDALYRPANGARSLRPALQRHCSIGVAQFVVSLILGLHHQRKLEVQALAEATRLRHLDALQPARRLLCRIGARSRVSQSEANDTGARLQQFRKRCSLPAKTRSA